MIIRENAKVKETMVNMEGASNVTMRILIGTDENSENIIMRQFKILPGGHTPKHTHDFEHVVKIVSGKGQIEDENGEFHELNSGNSVFVVPGELHQFSNPNTEPFVFLCIIKNAN